MTGGDGDPRRGGGPITLVASRPAQVAYDAGGKRRPIRFWLRWLVIVCVVPAWAVVALVMALSYGRESGTLRQSTAVMARALMQTVDAEVATLQGALQALATSPLLASDDLPAFHAQAQKLQRALDIGHIVLADPSRRQLVNTVKPFGAPLPATIYSERLEQVFVTGKPAISDLFSGAVVDHRLVAVAVPVILQGTIAFNLGMGIRPEHFLKILKPQQLPSGWVVAILDSKGTIIARTHDPEQFVGRPGAPLLLRRMAEGSESVIDTETLEGTPVFAAFSRSTFSGWTVAIGVPRATVTAELRQSIWLSIAIAATVLILGALAANALSGRISRSIRGLRAPALALASGETLSIAPSDTEEVAEVGDALVAASRLLAQRTEDREKAQAAEQHAVVADRTAARFRAFLDAAPNAIVVSRADGTISFANQRASTAFGYASSDLLGQSVERLIPERLRAGHSAHLKGFFAPPHARPTGTAPAPFARRKDGSEFPAEISLSRIELEGVPKVMAVIRDLTEQKRLEAYVETSRLQMISSARLSALGTMAGGIAHEVNNPLAIIHALASNLADDDGGTGQVRQDAERIVQYADRIDGIVKSLLYLARDGAGDPFTAASVADIVARALDLLAARFRQHSVTLATSPIDPGLRIVCREVQISQIVSNLLQNAFDAVQGKSGDRWVRLEVAAEVGRVVLSVVDSGDGVPPEARTRIMEPFFTTKPVGKGTGLGLSLSRKIAEDHGGTLTLGERDGHTCFTLSLPVSRQGATACN